MTYPATFWTGVWDPAREATSKEVTLLRNALAPRSPIVSFASDQQSSLLYRDRVVRLSGKRWLTYRAIAAALERQGRVTHVFGEMSAWHPLRSLGRRPILFTVAIPGAIADPNLLDKVTLFAAETKRLASELVAAGASCDRVRVIHPGVPIDHYTPVPLPSGRFTLLFASSPKRLEELEPRGVPLLVDLARLVPDVDIVLLWRRWGDLPAARRALAALDPPQNLHVHWADLPDPRRAYWDAHAVVCCFAEGHGKSCPNSLIEAMACGRPVLVTRSCGLADEIGALGGGVVSDRSADALAAGVLHLRADIARAGADARRVAVAHFDARTFCHRYQQVYEELRRPGEAESG